MLLSKITEKPEKSLESRMEQLQAMKGILTTAEYNEKRAGLLALL